jgi:hypothetical protein
MEGVVPSVHWNDLFWQIDLNARYGLIELRDYICASSFLSMATHYTGET